MSRSVAIHHTEWLNLVDYQGPFLTLPVLKRTLPQGLEATPPVLARQLRLAYEDWQADPNLHHLWIRWVLETLLEFDDQTLVEGPAVPPSLQHRVGEHGLTLRPDLAVLDPAEDHRARLLLRVLPQGVAVDQQLTDDRWAATPLERMVELCRAAGVRLGLVTNGDTWTLVDAPRGGPAAFATWEAAVWVEERITLDAFRTLLGAHRFFAVARDDTLEALLAESAEAEEEVTEQLGHQVRQAVELLVDAFSRADRDAGGTLLGDRDPEQVYLAAVTVMMRVVFLLSAEERGLLPLTDPLYQESYAVSTLRASLQEQADQHGEEPLERRSAAWHRLLATFRMVYAGVQHENLRLPAYGGSLFNPDRFLFLEGRQPDETWQAVPGRPLPVDDRTVLHILDAVQVLQFRAGRGVTEARRLSFRALDVEQIGHVYEGLLDHTAKQAPRPVLGLDGKYEPEVAAEDVASYDTGNRTEFVEWLKDQTGLTKRQIEKRLEAERDPEERAVLLAACDNDEQLAVEIEPYSGLLRRDLRGLPQVWLPGRVYVTSGSARRTTGTYYTPKVLAEEMVRHTLESLCYTPGPAEGANREDWRLRPARELLDLRVCDMAMGSGAFLVGACRYLAARLVEAWESAADQVDGETTLFGVPAADAPDAEVVPADPDDRTLLAHRVVTDRCLFGVDKNPMAVEMAKLSMWLITLAKDRPFSFLDHALRCGDSLLGITNLAQLEHLHPDPARGRELHEGSLFDYQAVWAPVIKEAIEKRRRLESFTVVKVADAQEKARLHRQADEALESLRVIGDVVIGAAIASANQGHDALDGRLADVASDVAKALDPDVPDADRQVRLDDLKNRAAFWLDSGRPTEVSERRTLHWPLEFPEIFLDRADPGFDIIIGNPPFLGGVKISQILGDKYNALIGELYSPFSKKADLCAYFFRRGAHLGRRNGAVGLLATNTIAQTITRRVGLDALLSRSEWTIYRTRRSFAWPGTASVVASMIWLWRGNWAGSRCCDGVTVPAINGFLEPDLHLDPPKRLALNAQRCFQGSSILGEGFFLSPAQARRMIEDDPENVEVVRPVMGGRELNNSPNCAPARWIIDMGERGEDQARTYLLPWQHLEEHVKPIRMKKDRKKYKRLVDTWWRYWHARHDLYDGIREFHLSRVLARSRVSDHHMVAFLPNDIVYTEALVVFLLDSYAEFAVIQSSIHDVWARTFASTLKRDVRYVPGDCFYTFPLAAVGRLSEEVGERYYNCRSALMEERSTGMTGIYNLVHDPGCKDGDVLALRSLRQELDGAVASDYGWSDLDVQCGFVDTDRGMRYTLDLNIALEVRRRLYTLNAERMLKEELHGESEGRRRPASSDQQIRFDV